MTSRREMLSRLGGFALLGGAVLAIKRPVHAQNGNNCQTTHTDQTETGYYPDQCTNQLIYYTIEIKQKTTICQNADGSTSYKTHVQLHGTGYGVDPVTGQPNGNQYIFQETGWDKEIDQPYNGGACPVFSQTEHYNLNVISKGSAPNEQARIYTTYSLDSSCNPTITYKFNSDTCKG